jgi:hypothetical protein
MKPLIDRLVPGHSQAIQEESALTANPAHIDLQALAFRAEALNDRASALVSDGRRALADFEFELAARRFDEAAALQHVRRHVLDIQYSASSLGDQRTVHVVNASCIYDMYRQLISSQHEQIRFVAGSRIGAFITMERPIELKLDSASLGHASANPEFTRKLLIECEKFGSVFAAFFHAHPGNGPENTRPSSIDLATQEGYERGGYRAIGGIFSRDGYLRFFTHAMPFQVKIIGKGIENEGSCLYRLTEA